MRPSHRAAGGCKGTFAMDRRHDERGLRMPGRQGRQSRDGRGMNRDLIAPGDPHLVRGVGDGTPAPRT